jgi:hypothetical protein
MILEPPLMMENYGIAFPNNAFAKLAVTNPNVLKEMDSS